MANFEIDEEVLVAFLKGELDAAQAEAVEAWYDRSAANRRMLGQVYYILYVSDRINDAAGIDVERSLRQFKRRMHAGRRISLRRIAVRIAAAAVVAAVLLAGGLTTASLSKRLARPVTVVTQLGERSQVVLPDGTKVWLNSSSSVEYVAPFFSRQRRVKMEGEAYFEVEHDRRAPFVVSTNGLDVEVLGTRFNIRNDDNEHRVTTVLLEGAVKAYASGREQASVRLHPAQQLVFDTRTHAMRLTDCPRPNARSTGSTADSASSTILSGRSSPSSSATTTSTSVSWTPGSATCVSRAISASRTASTTSCPYCN